MNLDDIKQITFPDGQTHVSLKVQENQTIDLICRIRTPEELFKLLMVKNVLDSRRVTVRLHIKYLMGARMDRAIDKTQPFTLKVVCDLINNAFPNSSVKVFCPHSEAVSLLLSGYEEFLQSERDFYYRVFEKLIENNPVEEVYDPVDKESYYDGGFTLILPDAGAGKRWYNSFSTFNNMFCKHNINIVECSKKRNMQTGKLSSFKVPEKVKKTCLILDDLKDRGGTFAGLAKTLRENGAKRVELAVCHNIQDNIPEGIDKMYTTNSFADWEQTEQRWVYSV